MIKDAMEKNEKSTPNGADLEVLKKHFGMCFNSDGPLDPRAAPSASPNHATRRF